MVSRPGDILDIGANTGTFAFMGKAMQPSANVVAFEPLARIASKIRKNVDISGLEVEIVQAAVSNSSGELPIYDPGGVNAYSASLEPNFLPGIKERYNVPVVSIDEYCVANSLNPTSIKIDVEGAEAKVLAGAKATLARRQTLVLCEWLGSLDGQEVIAELLHEIGLIAADLQTLKRIDMSCKKTEHGSNIIIGPAELICALPQSA
jgi:FkbM family methyltransferase